MKQLLLRVDDELHARLAAQARAAGKSVNALANEILGLGIDPSNLSRRDRLQLKLMVVGEVGRNRPVREPEVRSGWSEDALATRNRAIESMRGAGAILDEIMRVEREHL
jgi:plasmid stability protein